MQTTSGTSKKMDETMVLGEPQVSPYDEFVKLNDRARSGLGALWTSVGPLQTLRETFIKTKGTKLKAHLEAHQDQTSNLQQRYLYSLLIRGSDYPNNETEATLSAWINLKLNDMKSKDEEQRKLEMVEKLFSNWGAERNYDFIRDKCGDCPGFKSALLSQDLASIHIILSYFDTISTSPHKQDYLMERLMENEGAGFKALLKKGRHKYGLEVGDLSGRILEARRSSNENDTSPGAKALLDSFTVEELMDLSDPAWKYMKGWCIVRAEFSEQSIAHIKATALHSVSSLTQGDESQAMTTRFYNFSQCVSRLSAVEGGDNLLLTHLGDIVDKSEGNNLADCEDLFTSFLKVDSHLGICISLILDKGPTRAQIRQYELSQTTRESLKVKNLWILSQCLYSKPSKSTIALALPCTVVASLAVGIIAKVAFSIANGFDRPYWDKFGFASLIALPTILLILAVIAVVHSCVEYRRVLEGVSPREPTELRNDFRRELAEAIFSLAETIRNHTCEPGDQGVQKQFLLGFANARLDEYALKTRAPTGRTSSSQETSPSIYNKLWEILMAEAAKTAESAMTTEDLEREIRTFFFPPLSLAVELPQESSQIQGP